MSDYVIHLQDFRTEGSKVFTGRDRGREVREKSHIDFAVDKNQNIIIDIPQDIRSINPSFLEEFLYNVVRKFGKENFFKKVKWNNSGRYQITSDVVEAVDSILRDNNALTT
jgi:hypothetical protein